MSTKFEKTISTLTELGCSYFTMNLTEKIDKSGIPKKIGVYPNFKNINPANSNLHVKGNKNTLVLLTGSSSGNLVLIDWDLYKYDVISKTLLLRDEVLSKKIDIESKYNINTYIETTGNSGFHWIYKYNPSLHGIITSSKLIIDGVECGDIKGEHSLCFIAPSSYKSHDSTIKEYVAVNDLSFNELPEEMYSLFNFKYQQIVKISKDIKDSILHSNIALIPEIETDTETAEINNYLQCITNVDDFYTWMNVCYSLSNNTKYHQLVHNWAKQSTKYEFKTTQKLLDSGNGTKTIRSLYYMVIQYCFYSYS